MGTSSLNVMATTQNLTQFNLPIAAYATFDAQSLQQLMADRLKQSGLFPDIDFEGSNISAVTDILAFAYHLLLFYLNNTASESLFSQANLLENMNKIVALIGYNPTGMQTSLLNFVFGANSNLHADFYTLVRYSYINANGILRLVWCCGTR